MRSLYLGCGVGTNTCIYKRSDADSKTALVIIQAIDSSRGQRALATLDSEQAAEKPYWQHFIAAAGQGTARVWILVVAVRLATT